MVHGSGVWDDRILTAECESHIITPLHLVYNSGFTASGSSCSSHRRWIEPVWLATCRPYFPMWYSTMLDENTAQPPLQFAWSEASEQIVWAPRREELTFALDSRANCFCRRGRSIMLVDAKVTVGSGIFHTGRPCSVSTSGISKPKFRRIVQFVLTYARPSGWSRSRGVSASKDVPMTFK